MTSKRPFRSTRIELAITPCAWGTCCIRSRQRRTSREQVYSDLLTTFADVVRIRIDDPEAKDGTLSIEAHAQIAQKARDLLLAAACSAMEHRAVWHTKKPTQAVEQLRKLHVGQSERGSYIVTVISHSQPGARIAG